MTHAMVQSRVTSIAVRGGLFQFLHNHPDAPSTSEIADLIYFRWDAYLLVDRFIDDHGLYRPDGKIYVMWDTQEYPTAIGDKYGGREGWSTRYSPVWQALLEGGAMIQPADHQGPVFYRPRAYMASAIAETCTTEEEIKRMMREYCDT
ncbi:hypothetical protein B0T24DRAFT_620761 [Lasiosphaeria ovina]|uniref:Uncharacterized protein n=1 Tax=Lasiosphaeria ovina TaxID=92902 RepID=A0AAE0NAX9_9PEZI|nr:hypothetical protein B0T24DRAFT_620761 [Lasiosphaeria ovina]